MPNGEVLTTDTKNGIVFRDFSEHGELVLEQERVQNAISQVFIKTDSIKAFIKHLREAADKSEYV